MSVKFDITAVVPELMDEIIFMDDSPALEAFESELTDIIAGMAEKGDYSDILAGADISALLNDYKNAVTNLQRSYLLWSEYEAKEPSGKRWGLDPAQRINYCKIFYKAFGVVLVSLNGKETSVEAGKAAELKQKFMGMIVNGGDLYNKLRDFFRGYIYGWLFNYMTEQKLMPEYAEFIVSLAVVSDKIAASPQQKADIVRNLKMMLTKGRFKYINGYVPLNVMTSAVADRYELSAVSGEDRDIVIASVSKRICELCEYNSEDNTVPYNVTSDFMTKANSEYITCDAFAEREYENAFGGERTFFDGVHEDKGGMTVKMVAEAAEASCTALSDEYYSSAHVSAAETGLKGEVKGYLYPLAYKDGNSFLFSFAAEYIIMDNCDKALYTRVDAADVPVKSFLFLKDELKSTYFYMEVRKLLADGENIRIPASRQLCIRNDKEPLLREISLVDDYLKDSSEDDRRMNKIDKVLYLISGNSNAEHYEAALAEHFFGSKLFDSYIKFRTRTLSDSAERAGVDSQKKLVAQLNAITL